MQCRVVVSNADRGASLLVMSLLSAGWGNDFASLCLNFFLCNGSESSTCAGSFPPALTPRFSRRPCAACEPDLLCCLCLSVKFYWRPLTVAHLHTHLWRFSHYKWQSQVVATEMLQPPKPKYLMSSSLQKKFADLRLRPLLSCQNLACHTSVALQGLNQPRDLIGKR